MLLGIAITVSWQLFFVEIFESQFLTLSVLRDLQFAITEIVAYSVTLTLVTVTQCGTI